VSKRTLAPGSSADCTPGEVVLHVDNVAVHPGWTPTIDSSAAAGTRLFNPDAGAPKLAMAQASPASYFSVDFAAAAGTDYRIWIRGIAQDDFWGNDSVFVQFSDSVTVSNTPVWRIGTTSATNVNLEDCLNCGLKGWGWQDNGWGTGVLGPLCDLPRAAVTRFRFKHLKTASRSIRSCCRRGNISRCRRAR
jgi:hypothetical protein